MALIFIVIGLLFVGIDFAIPTMIAYPSYVYTKDIGTGIQNNIMNNILNKMKGI